MYIVVDVDEADVEVLKKNLESSSSLFAKIDALLHTITMKTLTASKSIKPVFAEINVLTLRKESIQSGLRLLQDVSEYALKASEAQKILASPIDTIGVAQYLQELHSALELLLDMKRDIRFFGGVVLSFDNAVLMAEQRVISYFSSLFKEIEDFKDALPTVCEAMAVIDYFVKRGDLDSIYEAMESVFVQRLNVALSPLEAGCSLLKRQPNTPYEKGTTGLTIYTNELISTVGGLTGACEQLQLQNTPILKNTIVTYLTTRFLSILTGYNQFVGSHGLAGQDLIMLDVLENLLRLNTTLLQWNFGFCDITELDREFSTLKTKCQTLLTDWVLFIENRVTQMDRFNEESVPQIVVEVISKIRRISEFSSLAMLIENKRLGSWLNVKPPLRFVTVFTSVVQGAEALMEDPQLFLMSSYLLDLIDELMIELELTLKDVSGENGMRKLAQGFTLIKNVVMIETIINRLDLFYRKLGLIGMERLQRLKKRFLKMFLDDWNYASYIIIRDMTQITTTNAMNGGQNSGKEKEQIKELFKNFNDSFEDALRNYEKFQIHEKDLRTYLSNEIKKLILNAYNKLYDKYGAGEFTKNRAKYIRYDKLQLEQLLNSRL
ncbi:Exo70-domain-containing protein [Metschnikowia bicuspidata]|uniref:Exo70-domain-containing protein n=1 Tax=Metschnikowia bicuspidata TaxID=27322 RepID=A0A4P9ZBD5_9ASCO|nr:Exo70-domain-containing protein [Metschnikowia bicuspidata]